MPCFPYKNFLRRKYDFQWNKLLMTVCHSRQPNFMTKLHHFGQTKTFFRNDVRISHSRFDALRFRVSLKTHYLKCSFLDVIISGLLLNYSKIVRVFMYVCHTRNHVMFGEWRCACCWENIIKICGNLVQNRQLSRLKYKLKPINQWHAQRYSFDIFSSRWSHILIPLNFVWRLVFYRLAGCGQLGSVNV